MLRRRPFPHVIFSLISLFIIFIGRGSKDARQAVATSKTLLLRVLSFHIFCLAVRYTRTHTHAHTHTVLF